MLSKGVPPLHVKEAEIPHIVVFRSSSYIFRSQIFAFGLEICMRTLSILLLIFGIFKLDHNSIKKLNAGFLTRNKGAF